MFIGSLFSLLLAASEVPAGPVAAAPTAAPAPRLIVAISVDQFSADLFAEYRPLFTAGLRRLQTGPVFPSGFQSHAATETCPGHSTILTGSHPARTGIIANDWYEFGVPRADKRVYCTEDPTEPGTSSANYVVSPVHLRVPTLGDRMKAANPASRVVSVAGKDRAAIMMGGHAIDEPWFWNGKAYVTLKTNAKPVPAVVRRVNAAVADAMTRADPAVVPAVCRSRASDIRVADRTFGTPLARAAGDYSGFRASLAFDRATTDIAIGLIQDMKLGQGSAPDVLSIGLSATDYVGHGFGTEGAEMCAQLMGVDENVGRILAALDATHVPYVVVLTADHGGHDMPERNRTRSVTDAVRADAALLPAAMGRSLASEFGLTGPVLVGGAPFGDIYLAPDVPDALRSRVLSAARARYLAHPQVAAVFTAEELRRMPSPTGPVDEWSVAERFRASFDPARSGDLLVALKPHVTPVPDPHLLIATHGSVWNYDRRVPILFYRPGAPGFEQPLPVETVDILPTLAALVDLPIPAAEIDGRCLDLDPGANDTCHAAGH